MSSDIPSSELQETQDLQEVINLKAKLKQLEARMVLVVNRLDVEIEKLIYLELELEEKKGIKDTEAISKSAKPPDRKRNLIPGIEERDWRREVSYWASNIAVERAAFILGISRDDLTATKARIKREVLHEKHKKDIF